MQKKRQLMIIEPENFADFLKGVMMGDTVAEFSARTGINQNLLYMMVQGKREPSEAVLDKVGLEIVYREKPRPAGKVKK
jgi:predicted transcriptional regulator